MSKNDGSKFQMGFDEVLGTVALVAFAVSLLWCRAVIEPQVVQIEQASDACIEVPVSDWDQLAPTP